MMSLLSTLSPRKLKNHLVNIFVSDAFDSQKEDSSSTSSSEKLSNTIDENEKLNNSLKCQHQHFDFTTANALISPRKIVCKKQMKITQTESLQTKRKTIPILNLSGIELENIIDEGNYDQFVVDMKEIGEGSWGKVYKATDKESGNEVAIKRINVNEHNRSLLTTEIAVHKLLNHKNIVNYFGTFMDSGNLWICMEYMNRGTLWDLLENTRFGICMNDSQISYIFREIVTGLSYLHSIRIIHRDLKSDNILLNENGEVKIADFGFCVQTDTASDSCGCPYWMAPEVISEQLYDYKADIWSIGIILYELLDSLPPYIEEYDRDEVKQIILEKGIPQPKNRECDKKFIETIEICTSTNSYLRPDCEELLEMKDFPQPCSQESFQSLLQIFY